MSTYKLSTQKLVRRILSRSSSKNKEKVPTSNMEAENCAAKEMEALKEQVENLKAAIGALQEDADKKDIILAKVVREKEKLNSDYLKLKQANSNLVQQLKDERKFYFKEKEIYCQEMNEYKKLKRNFSSSNLSEEDKKTIQDYKDEVGKLKKTLSQTLEVNYNLSIKFLRMKNTKSFLKKELHKYKVEHEKTVGELRTKTEIMSAEMKDVLDLRIERALTPSSKKYIQLVKQNSSLVYENLCLQLDLDRLNLRLGKLNLYKTKSETNSRLKYLKHEYSPPKVEEKPPTQKKKHKHVRLDVPEKLNTSSTESKTKSSNNNYKVVNIFERKEETTTKVELAKSESSKTTTNIEVVKSEKPKTSTDGKILESESSVKPKKKHRKREKSGEKSKRPSSEGKKVKKRTDKITSNKDDEKLELFQVSPEVSNNFELNASPLPSVTELERISSAPQIMESSKFEQLKENSCTNNHDNINNIS